MRAQILEAIRLATLLGFWDDVAHWEAELAKLDAIHEPADPCPGCQSGEAHMCDKGGRR